jgi:hypothetical protein
MMISGEKAPAFSAKTLNLPVAEHDHTDRIVELSRERYASNLAEVETNIIKRTLQQEAVAAPAPQKKLPSPSHRVGRMATNLVQTGVIEKVADLKEDATPDEAPKKKRTRRGGRGRKKAGITLPDPATSSKAANAANNKDKNDGVTINLR